jgi:hypothetical protein
MIEDLKKEIDANNWNAILEMHSNVSVNKNLLGSTIFFHDMETSNISPDEILELKGGCYLMDFSDGSTGAVLNILIKHVGITMFFNSDKKITCPQCGGALYNNNCTTCNQRGI